MTEPAREAGLGDDESLLAAFVGRNWNEHYRASFAALRAGRRELAATWNKAAFLAPMWLAYRGMVILQVAVGFLFFLLAFGVVAVVQPADDEGLASVPVAYAVAYVLMGAAEGLIGDRLLYRRAERALRRARGRDDTEAARKTMERRGGTSVLAAVVTPVLIVLFLAIFAGPWPSTRGQSREKAFQAAMKSDLRNYEYFQESHYADSARYSAIPVESIPGFSTMAGVTITPGNVTATGWSATARHAASRSVCVMYGGDASPPMDGARPNEPLCREER